ncbi:MAG: paraquat-inducible protein A [Proteobacteria bacterium]|nr:paraquat-inducible protein A [Pseudomonadota bacterium]MBU1138544.1 paraquat-inducible protein A [Pseudomonadota bacterium]MBU1232922.1 paraquat-inducible protein A [Pseudomonadota bacterium]MBU1419327.1 paraquat-inducible protein A [Pseudomonadota bacterium]MBU1455158.1 paraquat-inducible protein A [Pseudomonadota bacterium]
MTTEFHSRQTAMAAGLMCCHDCGKLVTADKTPEHGVLACPRCDASIHYRNINAVPRTWALILTAAILLFPANLLPIMRVDFLGSQEHSTIMDGILYFFHSGEYGIGLIIFIASVLVPLFKIIGMILILLSIRFKWKTWLRHKTIIFRFIQFVGRWSMLDIFVIALMSALVDFGTFTSTQAGPAATYFTAVVMCSMFAAMTFDPRLLWDA